jgi:hypothetical protein
MAGSPTVVAQIDSGLRKAIDSGKERPDEGVRVNSDRGDSM